VRNSLGSLTRSSLWRDLTSTRMWTRPRLSPDPDRARETGEDPLAPLVDRARSGDRAAIHALLVAIGPPLLRVARQVLGPAHPEVPDVAQDAAWGVLCRLDAFRGDCSMQHFACRVAVLTAMNVRRRERSQRFKAQRLGELEPASSSEFPSPERHVLAQRAAHALRALLDELPAPQAEVLCLHHMVGLTALEIATIAGVPLETVRSRLRLGRKALMARVHGDEQLLDTLGVSDGTDR
jgi:RNA polymerase sigma-70 factor, ECF subfamily